MFKESTTGNVLDLNDMLHTKKKKKRKIPETKPRKKAIKSIATHIFPSFVCKCRRNNVRCEGGPASLSTDRFRPV